MTRRVAGGRGSRPGIWWIELALAGPPACTPRIRAIPLNGLGHALLDTLPKSWSRDEVNAEFIQRVLAPADALLYEMDRKAALRACTRRSVRYTAGDTRVAGELRRI